MKQAYRLLVSHTFSLSNKSFHLGKDIKRRRKQQTPHNMLIKEAVAQTI